MTIFQGDIYWIDLGEPQGSEAAYLRPWFQLQPVDSRFSRSCNRYLGRCIKPRWYRYGSNRHLQKL
jgi:mRNA-degrading endonuclease toxin of MazEF toxin-antitoxin module